MTRLRGFLNRLQFFIAVVAIAGGGLMFTGPVLGPSQQTIPAAEVGPVGESDPAATTGAPEPSSGRAVSWARATTPPGPTADSRPALGSPALQGITGVRKDGAARSTGLPDSGGRGPVSRDPRRAATVRQSAPQGARTGRTPSQAPKRVQAATARSQTGLGGPRGTASWYCLPGRSACTTGYPADGLFAAAGPVIRAALGDWRGRYVTVSTQRASVRVRLIDFCQCPNRLLDLYASVWFGLGVPLSAGLVNVEVLLP